MSPLKLMNHAPHHDGQSAASQSSDSGYAVGPDTGTPRQGGIRRSVRPGKSWLKPLLPSLELADPGSQLSFDKKRRAGLVKLMAEAATIDPPTSRFRLPVYDRASDQYCNQPPSVTKKLHDNKLSVASTVVKPDIKREDTGSAGRSSARVFRGRSREQLLCRNKRERDRVALVNFAYELLRSRIPQYYLPRARNKLNRAQILTLATSYIKDLTILLEQDGGCGNHSGRDTINTFGEGWHTQGGHQAPKPCFEKLKVMRPPPAARYPPPDAGKASRACAFEGRGWRPEIPVRAFNQSCRQYSPGSSGDWRCGISCPLGQTPLAHPDT